MTGLLLIALAASEPAFAQGAAPTQVSPTTDAPAAGAQLDRIRDALTTDPALDLNEAQLRFYVEILAKQPRFSDRLKGYDLINGPTRRGNAMSHQEFLSLVTPKELHSSVGIRPTELLQFALTNWLGQALIKRALEDMRHAQTDREIQDIRDRIDAELRALSDERR